MSAYRSLAVSVALSAVLACAAVSGCHAPEPESPEVGLRKPVDPPELPGPGPGPARADVRVYYNIWLGDAQDLCQGPAPFFEFDSSKTDAEDQPTMQSLATCMVNGPLKGRAIRLIGHTDPRGSADYNDKLGMERAEQVKRYLVRHNVDPARIAVESAGEEAASKAPAGWATDRRVEVRLAR
jgi:peptidoglycan-associated lipoprotein